MRLKLSKNNLYHGLGISIEGLKGDPADVPPSTSVFIEYYEEKVLCHIWTKEQQDCQTIELT